MGSVQPIAGTTSCLIRSMICWFVIDLFFVRCIPCLERGITFSVQIYDFFRFLIARHTEIIIIFAIKLRMDSAEFILNHRTDDVRALALKKAPEGVDMGWCLQQIEGWQLACRKLPRWAGTEGIWFPPKLSMEQCSSEQTALYKERLVMRLLPLEEQRHTCMDLTGGFGIDFSYMARSFAHAIYVEQQPHLCDIARHNMPLLGLQHADILCQQTAPAGQASLIYLDPARRDTAGRKTVAIEDCTPNVVELQDELLQQSPLLIIKLSPMLDITQALRSLHHVAEVHVVSVQGECKELLIVIRDGWQQPVRFHCANLGSREEMLVCDEEQRRQAPTIADSLTEGLYLYEPNASILKANCQDALCQRFSVQKLHPMSNLFVSDALIADFPGRAFCIRDWGDFSKQSVKHLLADRKQANLTIRNFPATVAELRKKLKLKEGGTDYIFATTLANGRHALILTDKAHSQDPY